MRPMVSVLLVVALLTVQWSVATRAAAAELSPQAAEAYSIYQSQARDAFLARVRMDLPITATREGVVFARPGRQDGIINVAGGLVHHWMGGAFIQGVTLGQVVDVSRAYESYSDTYTAVVSARILGQQENTYQVLMRLREREAGITGVLDVRSMVEYVFPDVQTAYAISAADEIREVKDAGRRDERLLPAGQDSGYLWRANTFTYFRELANGVYVEMETLGLSRRFPRMLGWLIEPIARRMGRKSVERSLAEFVNRVRAVHPSVARAQ